MSFMDKIKEKMSQMKTTSSQSPMPDIDSSAPSGNSFMDKFKMPGQDMDISGNFKRGMNAGIDKAKEYSRTTGVFIILFLTLFILGFIGWLIYYLMSITPVSVNTPKTTEEAKPVAEPTPPVTTQTTTSQTQSVSLAEETKK